MTESTQSPKPLTDEKLSDADPLLRSLAGLVNQIGATADIRISLPITLQTGGAVITGQLIPVAEYRELMKLKMDHFSETEALFNQVFDALQGYKAVGEDLGPFELSQYLHLKEANLGDSRGTGDIAAASQQTVLRVRICAVAAWTLGR